MGQLPALTVRPPELMDSPALDQAEHDRALAALARINWISGTSMHLGRRVLGLVRQTHAQRSRPLRIIDIACGGGDLTAAVARYVRGRTSVPFEMIGVDISGRAIAWARQRHERQFGRATLLFTEADIVSEGCPPCDVVFHSLFLHHLDDDAAIALLRSSKTAAAIGGVFSDLLRSWLGLILASGGTRLLARSRVARVDGPLSVRAARTVGEYRRLLDEAGLANARINRTWPERVCVSWGPDEEQESC